MSVEIGQSLLAFLNLRNWILHSCEQEWKKSSSMMCIHVMGQGQDCCNPNVLSASLFRGSQSGDTFRSLHAPVWLNRLPLHNFLWLILDGLISLSWLARPSLCRTLAALYQAGQRGRPEVGPSVPESPDTVPAVYVCNTLQRVARDNFFEFFEPMTIPSLVP